MAGIVINFIEEKLSLTKEVEQKFQNQIRVKEVYELPEMKSKSYCKNYDNTNLIWLEDMGNDVEIWFVKNIEKNMTKEIGSFNYRNNPFSMDYSEKYDVFFYILDIYSYKRGSSYELHIHYKNKEYEKLLSFNGYCKLSIDENGENLLISLRDEKLLVMPINDLVASLDEEKYSINISVYVDEEKETENLIAKRKREEAKESYTRTYSNEFGDD